MEKNTLKGVTCRITNCAYNEDGCKCTAGHIDVSGEASACNCRETSCMTFCECGKNGCK